jgi:uncharacterized protein YcnI
MKFRHATVVAAAAALALPVAAAAHVTVHPNSLPSGGFTVIGVRVPNEIDSARTTKVDVKFPPGFLFVSYQPMPGWSTRILYAKLAKPVTMEGQQITRQVDRVIFTSRRGIGKVQYVEFPLSVSVPAAKAGSTLTFKALQSYSSGKIVRWIGGSGSDNPAPQTLVTSSTSQVRDFPAGVPAARKTQSAGGVSLGVVGVGVAGIALAGVAFRRRRSD